MNNKKLLIVASVLLVATLACNSSRDVINSASQNTEIQESNQSTQPTQTFVAQATNTTAPAAVVAAEVVDIDTYGDDSVYFIGMIQNTGTVGLEFVEIHITLRDSSGVLVASESSYSDLDVIPVGGKSPFSIIFFENPGAWQDYEVTVEGEEQSFYNPLTTFEIVSANGEVPSFGAYNIVGEIRNTGSDDAEFVEVIAALYDLNGHIIGVGNTYTEFDKVTAGGNSPFDLFVFDKASGDVDHYELFIEGSRAD